MSRNTAIISLYSNTRLTFRRSIFRAVQTATCSGA